MTTLQEWMHDASRRVVPDGLEAQAYGGGIAEGGATIALVDAFPPGRLQTQLDRIEARLNGVGNRWAAFTDDELDYTLEGLNIALASEKPRLPLRDGMLRWQRISAMAADVQAELERRKP